ncbi:MAG TPA: TIGR00730 family Rossman fold protein [Candidatus Paceibacterota bacterium]|nr:TIGR00730 family Rossman fold protein [Candidatus Paceibacterota bacterium]
MEDTLQTRADGLPNVPQSPASADGRANMNVPASKLPSYTEPNDFRTSLHWRVFRIIAEFIDGWQFLADFKKTITFFGSARFQPGDRWYEEARKLGAMLAREGFGIVTGGGPGIMQAGNQGASEAQGDSIGLNIKLPVEQRINPYVKESSAFHYFFVRKLMLSYAARAYVFFPGGLGTLDEAFEILTLIQTKKISDKIPVVMVGKEFWEPIHNWIHEELFSKLKTIDEGDMKLYTIVDSAEEAFAIVKNAPPRDDFFY